MFYCRGVNERGSAGFYLRLEEGFKPFSYFGGHERPVLELTGELEHPLVSIDERPALGTLGRMLFELLEGFHIELVIYVIHHILYQVLTDEHFVIISGGRAGSEIGVNCGARSGAGYRIPQRSTVNPAQAVPSICLRCKTRGDDSAALFFIPYRQSIIYRYAAR